MRILLLRNYQLTCFQNGKSVFLRNSKLKPYLNSFFRIGLLFLVFLSSCTSADHVADSTIEKRRPAVDGKLICTLDQAETHVTAYKKADGSYLVIKEDIHFKKLDEVVFGVGDTVWGKGQNLIRLTRENVKKENFAVIDYNDHNRQLKLIGHQELCQEIDFSEDPSN